MSWLPRLYPIPPDVQPSNGPPDLNTQKWLNKEVNPEDLITAAQPARQTHHKTKTLKTSNYVWLQSTHDMEMTIYWGVQLLVDTIASSMPTMG